MSKRAEQKALEAYPPTHPEGKRHAKRVQSESVDTHQSVRTIFQKGYEQAEKDLALTWEDMRKIIRIDEEMMDDPEAHPEWMEEQPFYEEMLRRFKEARK